ncbi:hypothetical protein LR48_Vigan01g091400 [Vigna angularis]|uniref:DUF8039 domain-containing protein n=1 Tax=Phaseolus angularis TaxID=3914 RepID=A0A0L9TMH3_PHAAN|nr:hypothetical protein LR48_Vigan01g091400 [Vigna angularis]
MDLQWEERLNQSMRSMEQRFMEQLQEQKEIQRALEEKLHSMTQHTIGLPTEAPTPPRVNTRGSCSVVEPTEYNGQYELLVDRDPPRIVAVRRVLEGWQTVHGVPLLPQHVRVTIDEVRDPQAQVLVPTLEIHFVGEAIGIFIIWPRALIMSHIATPQFIHPHKQLIHQSVIDEDDNLAKAEDYPLAKLMTKLPKLNKGPIEVYMDTVIVDQGRSSMYEFVEPQTIQPSDNTIESKQKYLETWMAKSNKDIYFVPYIDGVMGKNRGQLVSVLYPKVCNKQLDSWECGYYVMSWIKTIIRAVHDASFFILQHFKSTSSIPEDAIKKIRQEWTTYLLQKWT